MTHFVRSLIHAPVAPRLRSAALGFMLAAALLSVGSATTAARAAVVTDWTLISAVGNAPDTRVLNCCGGKTGTTGYGSVDHDYKIGTYQVTNSQYSAFLNSVAATDTFSLYNPDMAAVTSGGGIVQTGAPGSFSYEPLPGFENGAVRFVSYFDTLRFANWLHNGEPVGVQDATTTEAGAYTFSAEQVVTTRNVDAQFFLPSVDEWYKSAFYDPDLDVYNAFSYGASPMGVCGGPTSPCVGDETEDVYTFEPTRVSPFGMRGQGGGFLEWAEQDGGWGIALDYRASDMGGYRKYIEGQNLGFRIATVPEPGTGLLVLAGLIGTAFSRRMGSSTHRKMG